MTQKTYRELYPSLRFDAAHEANLGLYEAEDKCVQILHSKFRDDVYVWEYGYYFLSLFTRHCEPDRSYSLVVSYMTEGHSALRAAFLSNLRGYHADAINSVRRAHEAFIKMVSLRAFSSEDRIAERVVMTNSLERFHNKLGLEYKKLYSVPSSFAHGNKMKVIEAWKNMMDTSMAKFGIAFGPQLNEKEFGYALRLSIFWLYAYIRVLDYIFNGQVKEYWFSQQEQSLKFLRGRLSDIRSGLMEYVEQVDKMYSRLSGSSQG